jgi:P27 family predicted phage terminase small subunit
MKRAGKKTAPKPKRTKTAKAKPLDQVPPVPEGLGDFGTEYWSRLAPLLVEAKILTPLHLESFRALCEAWERYRNLTNELAQKDSWTFETEKGYVAELPEVRMRDQALQQLQRLWPKFGLTPEALAKLGKHGGARRNKLTPLEAFAAAKYE